MKFTVVSQPLEPQTVFFTRLSADQFDERYVVGTIDLPIESPKEENLSAKKILMDADTTTILDGIIADLSREWGMNFGGIYTDLVKESLKRVLNPKKKLVTKEVKPSYVPLRDSLGMLTYEYDIPTNAKNVRCTYEVEE